ALSLSILLCYSCSSFKSPNTTSQMGDIRSEVRPVATLIIAVRQNDVNLFKSVYSSRMKSVLEKTGWKIGLGKYRKTFSEEFGEYQLDDFTLSYSGDGNAGLVYITFKNKQMGELRVIREDSVWKLNEK
ncbi:MAG: hypothetical protein V2A74_00290, partial [bacterium]